MTLTMRCLRAVSLLLALCLLAGAAGCRSDGPEQDAEMLLSEAMLAYQCFVQFSLKVDQTLTGEVEIDGRSMRPVIDARFSSMEDLRAYAERYFSDEICDSLLAEGHYLEWEGKLYSDNFDYLIDPTIAEVTYVETGRDEGEVRYEARVTRVSLDGEGNETSRTQETYEYICQKIDRGWVFTTFPYFWDSSGVR